MTMRMKITAHIPSDPHVGFGSEQEDNTPPPASRQEQKAKGVPELRHIGIVPEHGEAVPHLHWPLEGSQPSDPS